MPGIKKYSGFTLIEMLLVMVIIAMIIYGSIAYVQESTMQMRIDRASSQMQQILNASLAYYVANGSWPSQLSTLQGSYLPSNSVIGQNNPWGQAYVIAASTSGTPPIPVLYIWTAVPGTAGSSGKTSAQGVAQSIADALPYGYTASTGHGNSSPPTGSCSATSTTCYAVAQINVPGTNLNNASAINFAGIYHHGGCVPVPNCPQKDSAGNSLTPEIFVVPVSVSGIAGYTGSSPAPSYPITSFTAYAQSNNGSSNPPTNSSPPYCTNQTNVYPGGQNCASNAINGQAASYYWRVCLQVTTEQGDVQLNAVSGVLDWGSQVSVAAFTRCAIQNEPSGTALNVYGN
jgi:prepilin-type N-terminal cleavage/methylation domain-containing protein